MVKTLGAAGQGAAMRAGCARCLAGLATCLARALAAPRAEVDAAAAAERLRALLAEPDLLDNLRNALKQGNDAAAAAAGGGAAAFFAPASAVALAANGDGEAGEAGAELAEAAARCVAALATVRMRFAPFCWRCLMMR